MGYLKLPDIIFCDRNALYFFFIKCSIAAVGMAPYSDTVDKFAIENSVDDFSGISSLFSGSPVSLIVLL